MLSRQAAAARRKSLENETTVVVGMMVDVGAAGASVVVTYTVLVQPTTDNNPATVRTETAMIRFTQQTLTTTEPHD